MARVVRGYEPVQANEVSLQDVLNFLQRKMNEHYAATILGVGQAPIMTHTWGKKYIRIVKNEQSGSRSVYAFVDAQTGNIYKPANWNSPAKHIRGNLSDPEFSWGKALHLHGVAYIR